MEFKYDEKTHTYSIDGKKVYSVTQLLERHGIKKGFGSVPQEYLDKCCEKGNMVHEEIENFINFHEEGFTPQFQYFQDYVYPMAEQWWSEVPFWTMEMCGRVDLIGRKHNGSMLIVDIKTGHPSKFEVGWQTSMYSWGLRHSLQDDTFRRMIFAEQYVYYAWDENQSIEMVSPISDACIEHLLLCESQGRKYNPLENVIGSWEMELLALDDELKKLNSTIEQLQQSRDNVTTEVLKNMDLFCMKNLEGKHYKFTLVDGKKGKLLRDKKKDEQ